MAIDTPNVETSPAATAGFAGFRNERLSFYDGAWRAGVDGILTMRFVY
jgi:hypothetical protein